MFFCHPISPPIVTDSSQTDNTVAIIGGVVVAVVFINSAGTVIVIVVLVLRNRRGDYSKKYCDLPCNQCCIRLNCAGFLLYRHAMGTVETPARAVELSEDMYVYL